MLNGKPGNLLFKVAEDGRLQQQGKDTMLPKYTYHFEVEEQALLYAAIYCDPLMCTRLKDLGATELIAIKVIKIVKFRFMAHI